MIRLAAEARLIVFQRHAPLMNLSKES
jgi:hypothetical protein